MKELSSNLPFGLTRRCDFDQWWMTKYDQAKERFPQWLREIGRPTAYNGRVGPHGLAKAVGLAWQVFQRYLYNGVIPSYRNAEIICRAFGTDVQSLVDYLGIGLPPQVFFALVEHRECFNRGQEARKGGKK